jgi:hypothetical protein
MPESPERPLFGLDQNFPQPILDEALARYMPEVTITALRDLEPRLTTDHEDWEVIVGISQLGAEGFISNDDNMLDNPRVVAVVEQLRFTVVVCAEAGHDAVVASGLLLAHLPRVLKRHDPGKPQVWRIHATEQRPTPIVELKETIHRKSGLRVRISASLATHSKVRCSPHSSLPVGPLSHARLEHDQ